MQLELTADQEKLQLELRAYFEGLVEEIAGGSETADGGSHYLEYIARARTASSVSVGRRSTAARPARSSSSSCSSRSRTASVSRCRC